MHPVARGPKGFLDSEFRPRSIVSKTDYTTGLQAGRQAACQQISREVKIASYFKGNFRKTVPNILAV